MQNVSFSFTVDLDNQDSVLKLEKIIETLKDTVQVKTVEEKIVKERSPSFGNSTQLVIDYLNTKKGKGAFIYSDLVKNAEKIGIHHKSVYTIAKKLTKDGKAIVVRVPNPEAAPSAQKEQSYLKLV